MEEKELDLYSVIFSIILAILISGLFTNELKD